MKNPPGAGSKCPLCGQPGKIKLDFPNAFHGCHFSLHTCDTCALGYTFPKPSEDLLSKIYSGEYWTRETTVRKRGGVAGLVHRFNEFRLAMTIRPLLRRLPAGASVLEVGSGSGQLAAFMKRKGYNIEVTDISRDILNEIRIQYGIPGYSGNLENINFSTSYNAIIFNNVLEHLPDPVSTLKKAEQILMPGGFIFIEVPNIDSFQFNLFRKSWFLLQIPEHLFHFTPQSIQKMIQKGSLERVWLSTFSPRVSAAGYAASLSPALRPEKIRKSWSKTLLLIYLSLQLTSLPLVFFEELADKGSVIRALYRKKPI